MGKATIISEQGEGLYTIQPEWDTTVATARVAALTAENDAIDTRLGTIDAEITAAADALTTAQAELKAAITQRNNYAALDPESSEEAKQLIAALDKAVEDAQKQVFDKEAQWQNLKQTKSFLQLRKTANIKQIEFIEQMTATPAQVQAWCADYTEGATGTVGTIEIGRRDTPPIIKPGGEDGTAVAFNALTDGQLVPLMSSSPAATFVNYALLPGAAKWKARYRTGTASNIDTDTDTMDVALDALTIAGVACNQASNLTSVPVEYMTCNAAAFEHGDNVLVEFNQQWATPKVVGFAAGPKPCGLEELFSKRYSFNPSWSFIHKINHINVSASTSSDLGGVTDFYIYGESLSVSGGQAFDVYSTSDWLGSVYEQKLRIRELTKDGLGATIYDAAMPGVGSAEAYYGVAASSDRIYLLTGDYGADEVRVRVYLRETRSLIATAGPFFSSQPWQIAANEHGCVAIYHGGASNPPSTGAAVFISQQGNVMATSPAPAEKMLYHPACAASKNDFWVMEGLTDPVNLNRYNSSGAFVGTVMTVTPEPTWLDPQFAVGDKHLVRPRGRTSPLLDVWDRTDPGTFVYKGTISFTMDSASSEYWGNLCFDLTAS